MILKKGRRQQGGNKIAFESYSKSKEGSGMCRRTQLLGVSVVSVGIGILIGGMMESGFAVVILGCSLAGIGGLILKNR